MKREFDTFGLVLRMRQMVYSSKDFESLSCLGKRTEETIRFLYQAPLTVGSHDGAEVSVIYHTFIETCKLCGVSTLEYFKEFFKAAIKREQFRMHSKNVEHEQVRLIIKAIMQGRTDYERSSSAGLLPTGRKNMLPMTIGIKKN